MRASASNSMPRALRGERSYSGDQVALQEEVISVGDGRDLLLRLPPWSTHLLVQGPCYTQGQRTDLLGKVGPRAKAVSDSKGGHCLSRPEEGFRHRMSPEGHSGLTAAKEWAGSDPTPFMDKETEA